MSVLRRQKLRYVGKRLARAVLVVAIIAVLNFLLLQAAPGDAVDVLAGETGAADAQYMAELRTKFGLDEPLPVQLFNYVVAVMQLDLGHSFRYDSSVLRLILERVPATLLLLLASLGMAVGVGVCAGVIAARNHGRFADHTVSFLVLLAYATPLFWLGLMLTVVFSVKLGLLPSGGMYVIGRDHTILGLALDVGRHLVMPAVTLGVFYMAIYARLVKNSMLEVFRMDFIRTAVAKGLSNRRIVYRHALRNAVLPVVTVFGLQFGTALGGAVVVEVVFAWPGLGRLAYDALFHRDLNLLLGILFLSSIFVAVVNLAVDFAYTRVDPRIGIQ